VSTTLLATLPRAARASADLSQAELADRVRCDQTIMSRIECGASSGTSEVLSAIARELNVTVSYLLGEDLKEKNAGYAPNHPAAKILTDYDAPGGLGDLATDKPMADALRIKPTEWEALLSMKLPGEVSKDGYVQLLITMRAVTGGGR